MGDPGKCGVVLDVYTADEISGQQNVAELEQRGIKGEKRKARAETGGKGISQEKSRAKATREVGGWQDGPQAK